MDLLAFGAGLAMSVPRLSKEGGKTWREGESTRLSAWCWALRRLVAFRAMHGGGTKRELGAIESQPHASLPGPDTCMPKRERHRCDLRGSSQWGATAPRWFANIPRVPLAIEGGKSGSRHTNESGISPCLLLPYHPLHPSSKCARSRRRGMGKGTCCCQYQRGGLKRSTCSPRLLFNGPCQVLGGRHLLARVEACRTSIFNSGSTFSHLLVDATRQEHPNEKQQVPSACFCFSSIFHVCQKMDAQGTDHCRPAGSCHDFTTSPDHP